MPIVTALINLFFMQICLEMAAFGRRVRDIETLYSSFLQPLNPFILEPSRR